MPLRAGSKGVMRLEKYIATAGIGSRRWAKKQIHAGGVTVNGAVVLVPGHPIEVGADVVEFEGKRVEPLAERVYVMLHKPAGYLTTRRDERGRPTVMDLLADLPESLYPVGRLDLETEGLLLFTNDGNFAYRLLHPKHAVEKTYLVWVDGVPGAAGVRRLREGVTIRGGRTAPAKVRFLKMTGTGSKFEVVIHEGKKRQVRLMFKAIGHRVVRLKRVQIGDLRLGDLRCGTYRFLTGAEVSGLMGV